MMRLFIDGSEVELAEGTELELSDNNMVIAFDDISCQRTTNIKIPATAANIRLLELSNDHHTYGDQCRRRLHASVVDGIVSIIGYLYISSYDHSSKIFNACFVGGELTNLINVKNAGVIATYLRDRLGQKAQIKTIYDSIPANDNNILPGKPFVSVKRNGDNQKPSVSLEYLIDACANYFGVHVDAMTGPNKRARVELGELNGMPEYFGTLTETCTLLGNPVLDNSGMAEGVGLAAVNLINIASEATLLKIRFSGQDRTYNLYCFEAQTPIEIRINSGLGTTQHRLHDIRWIQGENVMPGQTGSYYGQTIYSNVQQGEWYTFDTGQKFALVDYDLRLTGGDYGYNLGAFQFSCDISIRSSAQRQLTTGDYVRLRDNLPEVTFIDLLKQAAVLEGKSLYYTEANGFQFIDLSSISQTVVELSDVISASIQTRTVGGYARHNIVLFNHDKVSPRYYIARDYEVANENIEAEKEVLLLPYSEGDARGRSVVVSSSDTDSMYVANDPTSSNEYCERVSLPQNDALKKIFEKSTELTVEVRMTLLEYVTLHPLIRIICRNTAWIWGEKRWKNGICTLKLVKI